MDKTTRRRFRLRAHAKRIGWPKKVSHYQIIKNSVKSY